MSPPPAPRAKGVAPAYVGNALCSRFPVTLPEPLANRAQPVSRSVIIRWLRGVVDRDESGYAVIAGNGRTVIFLYGEGRPFAAAVTRGPNVVTVVDALETVRGQGSSDFFAMTYPLPAETATALSGLFVRPAIRELFNEPGAQLKDLLATRLAADFTGTVVVRAVGLAWAALLVAGGEVIGCYGSDDRTLKATIHDVTALFHLDEVEVSVHPRFEEPDLAAVLAVTSTRYLAGKRDEAIARTETAMIELLSELENGITRAEEETSDQAEVLAYVLAGSYDRALKLAGESGKTRLKSDMPGHPLLEAHWISESGRVDTLRLLATLEMAAIPDAWLAASDALAMALELAVEQQLTWLAVADDLSSSALQETLSELLLQARSLIRRWRRDRRRIDIIQPREEEAGQCVASTS